MKRTVATVAGIFCLSVATAVTATPLDKRAADASLVPPPSSGETTLPRQAQGAPHPAPYAPPAMQQVPEPSTMCLVGAGLFVLAVFSKRRGNT